MSKKLNDLLVKLRNQYKEERDPDKRKMIAGMGRAIKSYLVKKNGISADNFTEKDFADMVTSQTET